MLERSMTTQDQNHGDRGDDIRVDTLDLYELYYWAQKLGVERSALIDAVYEVGPMFSALQRYFQGRTAHH
jgi:hypothetical protein